MQTHQKQKREDIITNIKNEGKQRDIIIKR